MLYRVTFLAGNQEFSVFAEEKEELVAVLDFIEKNDFQMISILEDPVFSCLEEFVEFMSELPKGTCPDCKEEIEKNAKRDIENNLKELEGGK